MEFADVACVGESAGASSEEWAASLAEVVDSELVASSVSSYEFAASVVGHFSEVAYGFLAPCPPSGGWCFCDGGMA